MALLDGFGVAQPEEHIIIVNETAEKYMPITLSPGEGGGGWGVGDGFCLPLFVRLAFKKKLIN